MFVGRITPTESALRQLGQTIGQEALASDADIIDFTFRLRRHLPDDWELTQPPKLEPPGSNCAWCHLPDHTLAHCPRPDPQTGRIPGCVICNTLSHAFDSCPHTLRLRRITKADSTLRSQAFKQLIPWLVSYRANKPQVQTVLDWRQVYTAVYGHASPPEGKPWSSDFGMEVAKRSMAVYEAIENEDGIKKPETWSPRIKKPEDKNPENIKVEPENKKRKRSEGDNGKRFEH